MEQPTNPSPNPVSPPWLLIAGLALGAGLLVFMAWESIQASLAGSPVVEVTEATWQKEVIESDIPVFVDFSAEWCGPCKLFAPTVARLAERYQGRFKVVHFDVGDRSMNKAPNLSAKYGINVVPFMMIFKDGKSIPFEDTRSEAELARIFDKVLASAN